MQSEQPLPHPDTAAQPCAPAQRGGKETKETRSTKTKLNSYAPLSKHPLGLVWIVIHGHDPQSNVRCPFFFGGGGWGFGYPLFETRRRPSFAIILDTPFSRKHGEGFFRWVHLSCSHESHYKVSLQGIIIRKVNARSHCKESLQGVIARSHCKESLQGVIARSHCKGSLQGVIARSHCKESLQGVMRVIASCKGPSAWSQVQVASARSQVQVASARSQVQVASAWSQVQVASARSQVQVASARSQVQLTCEELKSLLRAAG